MVGESDVQIVKVPEGLDPDEYSKTYGLTGLSALMETGRIQPIEFLIDFLRPENLANLQVQLDFIEQIVPMIAKLQSITAQDAYIRKLVEILPDFEYNQVEQAVNLRRENMNITDHSVSDYGASNLVENFADERDYFNLDSAIPIDFEEIFYENNIQPQVADRRNEPAQVFQPTIQVPKLSRSERAEEMLLHRMIYHSSVLKNFLRMKILDLSINVIRIYLKSYYLRQWFMSRLMNPIWQVSCQRISVVSFIRL